MKKLILFLCVLGCALPLHAKRIELVFWHAMAGHLGDEVKLLAKEFNQSQNDYFIKSVYKGNYTETITSFSAAFRAHQPPAIVQIFEVGTAIMSAPKGIIKPVDDLIQEQNMRLPKDDFIESVRKSYTKKGKLMALPFNLSAPIVYYNQDVLVQLGYNSTNFPQTWDEMELLAQKIKKAGYECVYTTAYPGWVLFESFLAIHGLPLTQGKPVRAAFDTPQLVSHFERLKRWHSQRYFRYAGREDDATVLFSSGVCPLFSQSSGAYNSLADLVRFRLGVASMPLDTQISPIRHANVVGGAALWAVAGQTKEQYKGIAQFFAFIALPKTQKRWHEHTGYLPLGLQGGYAAIAQNSHHPALLLAKTDLMSAGNERSLRYYGPQNQIRNMNDEVLEAMFADLMSPKQAVHEASARANHALLRFFKNTGH